MALLTDDPILRYSKLAKITLEEQVIEAINDALPKGYRAFVENDYNTRLNTSTVSIKSVDKVFRHKWDWAWSISEAKNWVKGMNLPPVGVKYDEDKPRMDLLPPLAVTEVAKVLAFGAKKYAPGNWKRVDDLQNRYTAAALRHIFEHMQDADAVDSESGIDTLAHAICCLMFKLEDKLEKRCKN